MRRRDFLALGSAALVLPSALRAQGVPRRVGLLMAFQSSDTEAAPRAAAFRSGLAAQGWSEGKNAELMYRYAGADPDMTRTYARELVGLKPDVLVTHGTPATTEVLALAKTTPIVFALVADPVGSGFVTSLGRPTGNVTGYVNFDATLVGKWVELLREAHPKLARVMMLYNPDTAPDKGNFFMTPLAAAGNMTGIEVIAGPVRSDAEIETVLAALAAGAPAAVVAPPDIFVTNHRDQIIRSAAAHGLPAMYPYRYFAMEGGLMSYGIDTTDIFRLVGGYVGQILNGTKVADLPIRAPTKFELVVNLKTAKALGVAIPATILARADVVIE